MGPITTLLIRTVLEWAVEALLLVEGLLALTTRELARRFGLQPPCILCTRIGHGPNHTLDGSLCGAHKWDVSSLAYCRTHGRLSDIRSTCRSCLLSFAVDKDSPDCDKYKPLIDVLLKDVECTTEEGDDPKSKEKNIPPAKCSCCGEVRRARGPPPRCHVGNPAVTSTLAPSPSPRSTGRNEEWRGAIESSRFRYPTRNESPRFGGFEGESPRVFRCSARNESPRFWSSEGESSKAANGRGKEDVIKTTPDLIHPDSKDTNEEWHGVIESPALRFRYPTRNESPRFKGFECESPNFRCSNIVDNRGKEDVIKTTPALTQPDSKDTHNTHNDSKNQTPKLAGENKLLRLPLNSAPVSPRWTTRGLRKLTADKPNDAGALTELETDILTRLRKQVRLDHSSLMELYMELDEERNASSVAANNAMAMITRLQAEKAAVQMEALQYQRMMEEQAEYDEEALQAMKDMLDKKDEELNALATKLDMYREKCGVTEKEGSESFWEADDDCQERKSHSFPSFGENSDGGSLNGVDLNESERPHNEHCIENRGENEELPSFDFEGERRHLLGMLVDLEKTVNADEEYETMKHEDEGKAVNIDKSTLTREVSSMKERLRAIEEDSGFLKRAAMCLQKGEEGTKLLTEIAQHLRQIRHTMRLPSDRNMVT